jgi:hypothetical protein
MSATELDEVQALLEHVLPDPSGYAQRLLTQAMTRWGNAARPHEAATFYSPPPYDAPDSGIVIPAGRDGSDDPAINTNLLLAAALGACECWGLDAGCGSCLGYGTAGWTTPDLELFEEFVQPAITKLFGADSTPPAPASSETANGTGRRAESRAESRAEPGESR